MRFALPPLLLLAALLAGLHTASHAADEASAQSLIRQNDCMRCHAIDKDKEGPAFRKIARTYKGRKDAEVRLVEHLTTGEVVTFPDGHEDRHKIVKVPDLAQLRNLVQWILSL